MALADAVERANDTFKDAASIEQQAFGAVDQSAILKLIGLNPRDPKAHAVVAVARRYELDPVLGHIAIIPRSAMPYITRDGFLFIAHRSKQLDGVEVIDGPKRDGREWVATVAVWRKDMAHAFIYPGRAPIESDNGPEMCIARAERRALKRAFAVTLPREFGDDDGPVAGTVAAQAAIDAPEAPGNAPKRPDSAEEAPTGTPTPPEPHAAADSVEPLTGQQHRALWVQYHRLGLAGDGDIARDARLATISRIVGREVLSTRFLNTVEAQLIIRTLQSMEPITESQQGEGEHA